MKIEKKMVSRLVVTHNNGLRVSFDNKDELIEILKMNVASAEESIKQFEHNIKTYQTELVKMRAVLQERRAELVMAQKLDI